MWFRVVECVFFEDLAFPGVLEKQRRIRDVTEGGARPQNDVSCLCCDASCSRSTNEGHSIQSFSEQVCSCPQRRSGGVFGKLW